VEDCIDELIEFEFFHSVSGLGQKQISNEEYQALRERLAALKLDIAVGLRKHPDTREVLRHVPARFLAGYDHMGQFALEWEGDRQLQRKRSHVTDDLINLVEAIGTAGSAERTKLPIVAPASGPPDFLPEDVRALFDRPVVAVHPGVGNAMRQWPPEHFASLVDVMVERNGISAVLIGGREEAELADAVLAKIANNTCVASVVGKTSLQQLPALLRACALYVGNNSGPKHIAAALGVPTIGIHSGVVDAIEWGPIGQRSVAVRRNMSCSPCYLARLEDCPRGFACMNGLEPMAVQEVAEQLLGRRVERRLIEPLVERKVSKAKSKAQPKPVDKLPTKLKRRRRQTTAVPVD
jgi:O-antigen biosynthesis protein